MQNQPNWFIVAIVSSGLTLLFSYIERLLVRFVERPKLRVGKQWKTPKGAKDDEGKPFVFVITGISIGNDRPFWVFPRDTAEVSETRIFVLDKDGNSAVGDSRLGRWWNYELADSDPLFPESYVIPQEENAWIYIPPAIEKRLILGYWIKETNVFYVYTTSSHKKNRWAKREERIKGHFPFFVRVEIIGKSFVDIKRLIVDNKNGELEIKETVFPFKEKV